MSTQMTAGRNSGNAYNLFILVITVFSLLMMVALLLPLSEATLNLLTIYDNLICAIFLIDFFLNLKAAPSKSGFFFRGYGWLDLLGSIPAFQFFKYSGLFRLARLSRLFRISRLMRSQNKKQMVKDILDHRNQYALFLTVLMMFLVLTIASVLVLQFESQSPGANITTGMDSFWYSIVTITTVGYGDYYPVTVLGRVTAMFIMITGVGIIGALASIFASLLVGPSSPAEKEAPAEGTAPSVNQELASIKEELAIMRRMLEKTG